MAKPGSNEEFRDMSQDGADITGSTAALKLLGGWGIRGWLSAMFKNGLDVNLQDQHTQIIDLHLTQEQDTFTLAAGIPIDTLVFNVVGGHTIAVGEMLCLREDAAFMQAEVLNVAVNAITIDTPTDFAFTVAAVCSNNIFDLSVDGSVTSQTFGVGLGGLQAGESWDITRLILLIEDNVVMDTAKFGGIGALTNGVVLRARNGIVKNLFNVKTNGEFAVHSYDVTYDDKAPAGLFGIRIRSTFAGQEKRGVTIRLDRDTEDSLDLIIQDDLRDLSTFRAVAQGHVVID